MDTWIGAYDLVREGYWFWKSNYGPLYLTNYLRFWAPGQPDNVDGNQHCAAIQADGLWADFDCDVSTRQYICQAEKGKSSFFVHIRFLSCLTKQHT